MAENKRKTGEEYERRAGAYLAENGYEILEYNFRCRTSEIDIIARDGEYIVFCEVKYRSGTGSGRPEEAVDFRKQKAISKCAHRYLCAPYTILQVTGFQTWRAVLTWYALREIL